MSLVQMLSTGDDTVHSVSAGCEAPNTTRLHPHVHGRVPLLALHPRGQLLEGSCQAPAASGQHSMSGRQHFPQLVRARRCKLLARANADQWHCLEHKPHVVSVDLFLCASWLGMLLRPSPSEVLPRLHSHDQCYTTCLQ